MKILGLGETLLLVIGSYAFSKLIFKLLCKGYDWIETRKDQYQLKHYATGGIIEETETREYQVEPGELIVPFDMAHDLLELPLSVQWKRLIRKTWNKFIGK